MQRELWYVEVKNFSNQWRPQLFYGKKPLSHEANHTNRTFRKEPVKVIAEHYSLPLKVLKNLYGPPTFSSTRSKEQEDE